MVERVEHRGRDDARLAHRAAEEELAAPGLLHPLRRAGEERAERAAEPLREAERDGVGEPADLGGRDARARRRRSCSRAPSRWTAQAELARRLDDRARSPRAARRARRRCCACSRATTIRVGGWCMSVAVAHRRADLLGREPAVVAGQAARDEARVDGRAAELVDQDVRFAPRRAARSPGSREDAQRDLVRHRRGRQEDAPPPARAARRRARSSSLTVGSSRSCSSPTSAAGHRRAHLRASARQRVGAEVDHGANATVACDGPCDSRARRSPPARRARLPRRQVWEWAARGAAGYDAMTNLPAALRAALAEQRAVLDARRSRTERQATRRHGQGALPHRTTATRSRRC